MSANRPGDVMGQGQVHVVAADQQMVADGHPLQHQVARLLGHGHQRQVGRAAADVADQQQVAQLSSRRQRSPRSASQA